MKRAGKRGIPAGGPMQDQLGPFRAQHLDIAVRQVATPSGVVEALFDDSESPLAWLARRKGRDGRCLIDSHQFLAGERLRADFTRGNLTPRVTSNWSMPTGGGARDHRSGDMTDLIVASRQRLTQALHACGPEFAGLLMDVCCFLRGLEDVERERGWPSRSAKIVLQLGLDRLARHYGYKDELRGYQSAAVRVWRGDETGTGDG